MVLMIRLQSINSWFRWPFEKSLFSIRARPDKRASRNKRGQRPREKVWTKRESGYESWDGLAWLGLDCGIRSVSGASRSSKSQGGVEMKRQPTSPPHLSPLQSLIGCGEVMPMRARFLASPLPRTGGIPRLLWAFFLLDVHAPRSLNCQPVNRANTSPWHLLEAAADSTERDCFQDPVICVESKEHSWSRPPFLRGSTTVRVRTIGSMLGVAGKRDYSGSDFNYDPIRADKKARISRIIATGD
ncbi:hypothetical protein BGZ61DRAFT_478234 [Ilyonectria robusta]|uniref:uncharacterized protein n=1 Tax=Ilyonectria robusta TaxID=1079257 RepID=UPI001E8E6518|nr:uncharacterized protein BGZ61DRAFT_478234 [Ilyonectria robusta]KAH8694648.1 hypothetical protein BGZ61DRAFT_478234 [Ilyonectria robusta]